MTLRWPSGGHCCGGRIDGIGYGEFSLKKLNPVYPASMAVATVWLSERYLKTTY
jgi:hypothetical protein